LLKKCKRLHFSNFVRIFLFQKSSQRIKGMKKNDTKKQNEKRDLNKQRVEKAVEKLVEIFIANLDLARNQKINKNQ